MSLSEIPDTWVTIKFTDVLDVQGGTQPPKSQFLSEPREGYIRLLQIRDFGKKPVPTYIPDTLKLKKCSLDDVLIGRYGASLGRICTGMEGAYNVALAKVLVPHGANTSFIRYYLLSDIFQRPLMLLSRSAQNGFNKEDLATFDFVLPPIAEQKQIAAKLDELLAQVDTLKTRLDAIPAILKRFRQSVLAAAVSGRLTEEWRNSHDSVSWKEEIIDDLVYVINGKAFPSKEYQSSGVKLLRPGNLHLSGKVIWNENNTTYIPDDWLEKRPELILQQGALLMNLTAQSLKDEFLGRVCILEESGDVLLNQRICSFESKTKYDIKPYLYIYFKSPIFREYVATLDSGSLIKHLNVKDVKSHGLLLPGETEQIEIVRRVEQLFTFADQIEQRVKDAQSRVNHLTQSILAKAFRGELTAEWREQNPDLISGENSAEALLNRIKAQRKSTPLNTRTRKKRV